MPSEFWLLPLLLLVVWYWLDSMRAREQVLQLARQACKEQNVQLLDQTVAQIRLRTGRDSYGRVVLRRRYRFEFSQDGEDRSNGEIELLGRKISLIHLDMGPFAVLETGQGTEENPGQ